MGSGRDGLGRQVSGGAAWAAKTCRQVLVRNGLDWTGPSDGGRGAEVWTGVSGRKWLVRLVSASRYGVGRDGVRGAALGSRGYGVGRHVGAWPVSQVWAARGRIGLSKRGEVNMSWRGESLRGGKSCAGAGCRFGESWAGKDCRREMRRAAAG